MAPLVQLPPGIENFSKSLDSRLGNDDKAKYKEVFCSNLGIREENEGDDLNKAMIAAHKGGFFDDGESACKILSNIAKKTSGSKEIQEVIEKHKLSFPKWKAEFVGREEDVKRITERLRNKVIPGINLFGESGVGKTTLAREVAKEFGEFERRTIDLRDIQDMETVYTLFLMEFGVPLKSKSSLDKVYECLDKTLTQKTLVILDNVEQLLKKTKKEFSRFLKTVFETKACKNRLLKSILTSQDELNEPSLKGKFFSEYEVKPLKRETSKNFITKRRNNVIGVPQEESDEALNKISKICRNLPYLLQVIEQLIRSSSSTSTDVLQNLNMKIKQNVPEQFVCVSELFDSLPSVELKEVAVKMSLLRRPFSVSTAMKIAGISSDYDAELDLEILASCKIISVVDVKGKRKYDTHGLFKDFIKYLCSSQPDFCSSLKKGEKQFFKHFSGKMSKLARNFEKEFVQTYSKLELNTANFELALALSEENKETLDLLLHTDDHDHFVLMGIMFEVLKDVDERRDLFAKWADAAEKQENWLASALMRCWQSLQCSDIEGRRLAQPTLDKAYECLKKAEQKASSDQVKEVQSLCLHSSGKIKYYKATQCARGSKERKDLFKEGIEDLKKAISIRKEILEDSTLTSRGWNLIGNCYLELDEPENALWYYEHAMELKKRLVGSYEHWEFPTFYNQIAQVHDHIGRKLEEGFFSRLLGGKKKANKEYEEAEKMTKKALELQEKLEVSGTNHTAIFQRNLANILLGLGKYEEALEWAQKSYEIRKKLLGKHPDTVRILYTTGTIHEWRKDPEAALQSYEEGVEMEESLPEDGHSAVRNKLYERIEKMCSRLKKYPKKYPMSEKHSEKIRILYLTGICQEYKEDPKALESYEEAVKIEDCLPEGSHSLVRKKLYQRLAGMYKKLDQEDKLRKIEIKINKIVEQEKESATGVCESSEFEMNVYKNGGYYDHSNYGHFIYVPPNTVTEPTKITCKVFNSHPILSPAKFTEGLASYIVELGPTPVALQKPIIMTLLHSAPVKRHGYEVTVRSFNAIDESWSDVEVLQEDSHAPEYCECRYLQVSLQQLSTLAVVTRLITDRFHVTPKGCFVRSSICHDVTVKFPEGAVDRTVEGILNVLPEERFVIEDSIVAYRALLFHGFQGIMFSKPVTISVPFVSSIAPGSRPLLLRLDFDGQSKGLWKNVKDFDRKDDVMEFSVDHFSGFLLLDILNVSTKYVVDCVNGRYQYWFNPPTEVTFAAYKKEQTRQDVVDLQLTCVANEKQRALNDKMQECSFCHLVQSEGDLPMRRNERAYLDAEGVSDWERDFFLRFPGVENEECSKQFYGIAQRDCRVTKLSFFNGQRDRDHRGNKLCTLNISNLEENSDFSEYFGVGLDVLMDSPEDILFEGKILEFLKVDVEKLKKWDTKSVHLFYSSLPRNEDCYNALITSLDSHEGSKHISGCLKKSHDLVLAPITSLRQKIQDKVIDIVATNTRYYLPRLADYLGVDQEFVNECRQIYASDEQVSQMLRKRIIASNQCTIQTLLEALQHLKLSKCWKELVNYTTKLSKELESTCEQDSQANS